ncbi:hypothetical protein [Actinokineospora globicatena]|uniref:hypothetical protein n=1 Tax=Actinokineospora globicatena TaxID=103729 RepID=UPI0020A50CD8|nr:hypothetical protein [Actinokineospora globicatena]MCP2303924.1 hypothetical protein [Actinokineospora globicatena]GLW78916.1 hypothetical protein Aglo01_33980 [Actinokineospora globicatena]GLW86672.1 hypothetical protein Aglo02_43110 [Actinokineospora globicatena]
MVPAEDPFDHAMRKAGIDVPPDLRRGTVAVHRELAAMAALLRVPRHADSEPAGQYRIDAILPGHRR